MRDVQEELSKHSDGDQLVHGTSEVTAEAPDHRRPMRDENLAAEAASIANEMRKGLEYVVRGAKRVDDDLRKYSDKEARVFIKQLARRGVIPEEEGNLGRSSPSLSKLLSIAAFAETLRHPEVAKLLPPSVSTIYHVAPLYKEVLKTDKEDKHAALVQILTSCKKPVVTRQFLLEQTQRLRTARKKNVETKAPHKGEGTSLAAAATLRAQIDAGAHFNLAVITPGKQLKQIGSDYADGSTLDRSLPIHKIIDKTAAVVVFASISDLPVVVTKLLPLSGFKGRPRILLTKLPGGPEITDLDVIIVAQRGGAEIKANEVGRWLEDTAGIDPIAIGSQIFPDCDKKVHFFAGAPAEGGWVSLVGDNAWIEKP